MAGSGNAHLREPEDALLRVENLHVEFPVGRTGLKVHAVSDVSVDVRRGETLGLVGESGCGKSTTGKAIMQIERATSGTIEHDGTELTSLSGDDLRAVRPDMQMIFQDPISSLNPRRKVGDIVAEPLRIWASEQHPPVRTVAVAATVLRLSAAVAALGFVLFLLLWLVDGFYPYLFNNDFAIARPFYEAVLASAGELTVSAVVLGGVSWALAQATRDRLAWTRWGVPAFAAIMVAFAALGWGTLPTLGESLAVSSAVSEDAFEIPDDVDVRTSTDGTTEVEGTYERDGSDVTVTVTVNGQAVNSTQGEISGGAQGAELALLGLALALAIVPAVLILLPGSSADYRSMADLRLRHREKVREVLTAVGLDPEAAWNRRPHQFSGGQCQRICIARSLVLDPDLIICDEPVSALDVSVQAQILNLLQDMKARYDLTLVFIAHDLAVVKNVSDRVAVMYLGKLCEVAAPDDLYANPAHPYTAALLGSIPVPNPDVRPDDEQVLGGEIPSPVAPPSGCRFRTRCPKAQDRCAQSEPKMTQVGLGHYVACHFPLEATKPKPKATSESVASRT